MGVGMVMTEFGAAEDVPADIEQLENTMYVVFIYLFTVKFILMLYYICWKKLDIFLLNFYYFFIKEIGR